MIKLTPLIHPDAAPLSGSESQTRNYIDNLANTKLAANIEERIREKKCENHPDFENQIEIDLSGGEQIGNVVKYCCEDFKALLDLVAQNKVPPGW